MFLTLRYGQINSLLLKNKNVLLIALVINTKIKVLTKITNEQRCTSSVDRDIVLLCRLVVILLLVGSSNFKTFSCCPLLDLQGLHFPDILP